MCGRRTGTSSQEDRTDKTQRKEEERHKKSGEQAAKNMSEAVHERTCVVARREEEGPIIKVVERDSDVCLFWAKSQHPSIQLLTL